DVAHLADSLGIDRFWVAGTSGGAPYVAACGVRLADRIPGAAIVAGFGPLDLPGATEGMVARRRVIARLLRGAPPAIDRIAGWIPLHRRPETVYRLLTGGLAEVDREGLRAGWAPRVEDVTEALRPGLRGLVQELRLVASAWGFSLEEVAVP